MVSTFRDQAFRWFTSLQLDSISSYGQLMEKFTAHFNNSRAKRKSSETMKLVKQRRGETLREFWVRFNVEALDVTDFNIEERRRIMYNNVTN